MANMCKGVQHPTRGLFLRAYLVQSCRGLLPDTGSPYESEEGGNVSDAIDFLLSNFTEMNKLWVRMKFQTSTLRQTVQNDEFPTTAAAAAAVSTGRGAVGFSPREGERVQLADLVGKNLTHISQLDGLTFDLYKDKVLPKVLEQVVACKDELAQVYSLLNVMYLIQKHLNNSLVIFKFSSTYKKSTFGNLLSGIFDAMHHCSFSGRIPCWNSGDITGSFSSFATWSEAGNCHGIPSGSFS